MGIHSGHRNLWAAVEVLGTESGGIRKRLSRAMRDHLVQVKSDDLEDEEFDELLSIRNAWRGRCKTTKEEALDLADRIFELFSKLIDVQCFLETEGSKS